MRKISCLTTLIFLLTLTYSGFAQTITIDSSVEGDDIVNATEATTVTISGTSAGGAADGTIVRVTIGGVTEDATISGADGPWMVDLDISGEANGPLTVAAVYDPSPGADIAATNNNYAITLDQGSPTAVVTVDSDPIFPSDLVQVVTVTYDEPMDPLTSPTIAFSSSANFTSAADGAWSGLNTVWTETFNHDGTSEQSFTETADVASSSGATDIAGNADVGDSSPSFVLDTQAPTATVTVDSDPIYQSDLAQVVTVTYDEAMDALTSPTITFSSSVNFTSAADGGWTVGNTVWTETFNHDGTVEEIASETADVASASGATDVVGIADVGDSSPSFVIDTQSPTAVVAVDSDPIYQSDLAQVVTVTYDEAMDPLTSPTIAFSSSVNFTSAADGGWTVGNTVWTETFNHDGTAEEIASETADVASSSGATDLAGNVDVGDSSPSFAIDTQAPTATVTVDSDPIFPSDLVQVVTVTYDEPMDPLTSPTIAFSSSANFTSAADGAWSGLNTVWTETFNHDGTSEQSFTETADVASSSGATDIAGNADVGDSSPSFVLDTQAPTATVTVDSDPIYQSDLAQVVTVTYDEAMDALTSPTITFSSSVNFTSAADGGWTVGNTVWTETFNHDGTAEEIASETADVASASGATDVVGIADVGDSSPSFVIDTQSPTAVVTVDSDPIYQSDLAQVVTVTYDEAMDPLTSPTIAFSSSVNFTSAADGGWTVGNTVWTETFNHDGTAEEIASETADVASSSGATDLAGNVDVGDSSPSFAIDTQAPTATVTVDSDPIFPSDLVQVVTVTYDEPMDPLTSPTIAFSSSANFTSAADGAWSGLNTVWTETFNHDGTSEQSFTETADVASSSGATDIAGNADVGDSSPSFVLDTQAPTATVTVDSDPIYQSDLAQVVTVTYDEAMDALTSPTITFSSSVNFTSAADGGWTVGNTVWTETFNHDGTAEEIASETADVASASGATDVVGIADVGDSSPSFVIDTQSPTFVDATFYDNDNNGSIDEILVEFSEDVDEATVSDANFNIASTGLGGTSFTVFNAGFPTGNGIDASLTDNFITLLVTIAGTTDQTISYTAGSLADEVGNLAATDPGLITIDLAAPVITSASTADVAGTAGEIDQITVTFSENIDGLTLDTDGGSDDFIVTDGAYTYTVASVATSGMNGAVITLTERGSPDTGVTPDINLGISDIEDQAPTNNTLGVAQDFTVTSDGAAPVVYDFELQATNSFIQVVYSEPIQPVGGGTPVLANFNENQANVTAPTTITINDITNALGDPLVAAEDTIQFTLTVGPVPSTYDAGDNVVIDSDGATLEDAAGNPLGTAQSTGNVQVNDVNNVVTIVGATWVTTSAAPNFEGYIELEFSDGVYGEDTGQSIRLAHSVDGIYEQGDWTDGDSDCGGDDQLCGSYLANGSTVFVNTDSNNDVELRAGANGSGGAGDADDEIRFSTTSSGNIVNYTGTLHRFQLNDIDNGPWTGAETYTFGPSGANSGKINGRSTASTMIGSYTFVFTLPDLVAEDFDNATATALDTDADGNIDAVEVVMPDGIEDATITLSDFQFNSITPSGFDTGSTPNDNTFRLLFDSYPGTAVLGNLVYTAGTLEDDAEVNASYLPSGNAVDAGTITPVDAAGPVILSALTEDTEATPDGFIDQITVTFSETFSDISIDATDFSLSDSYVISGISVSSPDIVLMLTEMVASDTYIAPDVTIVPAGAGMLEDLSAGTAPNPAQTFSNTTDGAAPYSEVDILATNDSSPEVTGTVDDPNATVLVNIGSSTVAATNNGNGTWTLADNSIVGLPLGNQEVTAICVDPFGNTETDVTSNELTINGGANITPAAPGSLCTGDGFQPLGSIQVTETGNGDFGSSGTILLTLPAGFEFNTSITPNSAGSSFTDISVAFSYVGTATLSLNITYDGSDDGIDDLLINGLEFMAVTGGVTGDLERAGGTASLLTTDTNYATLTSNTSPANLTSLEETSAPGSPITSYTTSFTPRVTVSYLLGPSFSNGEDFVFSGGATGTMVGGTLTPTSFDMYLTSGTVGDSETVTGQTSLAAGTTTAAADGVSNSLFAFTLDASTASARWYDGTGAEITPQSQTKTNAALSATTPGLYTFDVTDDNGTCESSPLRFNVLVYNDVHPDNNKRTFVDQAYIVTDDRDTVFISNPAGHTVSVTGNGISVVGGGSDPLLAIFDPAIAGDDGGGGAQAHTITYSITNNTTLESTSRTVTFTVEPETEIFTGSPVGEYCADVGVLDLTIDNTGFNLPSSFIDPYIQRIDVFSQRHGGINLDLDGPAFEAGGVYSPTPYHYDLDASLLAIPNGDFESVRFARVIRDAFGVKRVDAFNYFLFYGTPAVTLTNVAATYCEDDAPFTINRTLSYVQAVDDSDPDGPIPTYNGETNQPITNGYLLYRSSDMGATYPTLYADFTAGGTLTNTFDPTDPDQDGPEATDTGFFRIIYTTEDNLTPAPGSCVGTYTIDVRVNPDTPTPTLDVATEASGGSDVGTYGFIVNGSPDAGVDGNEYLLEYCVGDPAGNIVTGDLNTVRWYDENLNLTAVGTSVTPAQVGLATSGGRWTEQSDSFYFTSTDATGCESDYRLVTIEVYPIPDAPNVDLTGWPASVQTGTTTLFDYCIPRGGSVNPDNIVFDALGAGEAYSVLRTFYSDNGTPSVSGYLYQFNVAPVVGAHSYGDAVTVPHTSGSASGFVYSRVGGVMILALNSPGLTFNPGSIVSNSTSGGTATTTTAFEEYFLAANEIDVPVLSGTGTVNYFQYTVRKTSNINGSSDFAGCTSSTVDVYAVGWEQPLDPTIADIDGGIVDLHIGEGGSLDPITHGFTGMDGYIWYENSNQTGFIAAADTLISGESLVEAFLTPAPVSFDPSSVAVQYTNDTYVYYFSRIDNAIPSRGFDGCESAGTLPVNITVHASQRQPVVASNNLPGMLGTPNFSDLDGSANNFYSICTDQLEADIQLVATEPMYGGASREFKWYVSNASFDTRGSELATDGSGVATFSELGLAGLSPASTINRYFEVVQVTDNDVFAGVESASTFIRIDISPQDALEFRDDVGGTIGSDFCRDEGTIVVDLFAGGTSIENAMPMAQGTVNYLIDSYLENDYIVAGSPTFVSTGTPTAGNPTLDLQALHTGIGGSILGEEPSKHVITMNFTDGTTLCTGTISKVITIHPDPHISIEINGIDINDVALVDAFCYENGNVALQGVQYIYDNTGIIDTVNLVTGQFTSDQTGNLGSNVGQGTFNPIAEHNAAHGGLTGTDGIFENRTAGSDVSLTYTDGFGCDRTVSQIIFIDPEPEEMVVDAMSPEDGDIFFVTDICNDASGQITAEIRLIDPTDPAGTTEENDYSMYTFNWFLDGQPIATNLVSPTQENTNIIAVTDPDFGLEVNVTDLNGCTQTYFESHQKQELPDLDFPEILDLQSFCSDDTPPTLTLEDLVGGATTVAAGNVQSWQVLSYATNRTDTATYVDALWADATVEQDADGMSIPQINLQTWHEGVAGNPYVGGQSIGGNSTVHTIYITYTDPTRTYQGINTLCENTYRETIIINPDPDISITLNDQDVDDLEFCHDDINISLQGIDLGAGFDLVGGTQNIIRIDGDQISTNGQATFNASRYHAADPGTGGTVTPGDEFLPQSRHTIEYVYEDENGCERTITRDFLINPRPRFTGDAIQTASTCATSSVELFVDMTDGASNYTFIWFVNGQEVNGVDAIDEDGNNNDERITYDFGGQLTANFAVTATYIGAGFTTSCVASVQNSITVGAEPIPAMTWVGITSGSTTGTDFTITEDNATLPDGDVDLVELEIDGTVVLSVSNPSFPLNFNYNPGTTGYSFGTSGEYTANLTMNTSAGCDVTISRAIRVLPHFTGFSSTASYSESFETAASFDLTQGGWLVDSLSLDGKTYYDTATSWTRGGSIPGTVANIDGTSAVYTAPGGTNGYRQSEVSFVYSPSFDLSGFSAPTVSFLRYEDFETFRDGAVFQASVDDGRTWQTVGTYNAALEAEGLASTPGWYNREAISSSPGSSAPGSSTASNVAQVGWALNSDWQEAISPIEINPAQSGSVRFRFALSAQAGDKTTNGFGFDLVRIYERNQIVLLELFSSTLSPTSLIVNDTVNSRPQYLGSDILKINYFTDLENSGTNIDQINQRNTTGPGAMVAFYGVGQVPSLSISGDANFVDINGNSYSLLNAKLANSRLNNPAFDIVLNASVNSTDGMLSVDASFTATTPFVDTDELALHIAVVEPLVTLPTSMGLYPAGASVQNVLRKMLPSAAGQFEQGPIAIGESRNLTSLQWPINNMFDPSSIRVIAYIQDLNTKQIYQASSVDIATGLSNNVLGLDDLADFSVYPNPADKAVTVEFAAGLEEATDWVIFDQAGREVLKGQAEKGTATLTVQTSDMPSGMYFIHLYSEDKKQRAKRLMIIH